MRLYVLLVVFVLVACSSQPAAPAQQTTRSFPLAIENCGRTTVYTKPPKRVVVTYPSVADLMYRLGLGDRIVASLWHYDMPLPADTASQHAQVHSQYAQWMTKAQYAELNADFVLSAYNALDFTADNNKPTVADIEQHGGSIYAMSSECDAGQGSASTKATYAMVYDDIRNLGAIFGVPERAEAMIGDMQQRISMVQQHIAGRAPLRALIYQGGEEPLVALARGRYSDMLRLAGAESILFDAQASAVGVSAETVRTRDPEVFVVIAPPSAEITQQMSHFLLRTFPTTTAGRQQRIVPLRSTLPAGYTNVLEIEQLAQAFHPEVFPQTQPPHSVALIADTTQSIRNTHE